MQKLGRLNEYEKNKQNIIDKLKDNQSDIQKKHRDNMVNFDNDKMKYLTLLKIQEEDNESKSIVCFINILYKYCIYK